MALIDLDELKSWLADPDPTGSSDDLYESIEAEVIRELVEKFQRPLETEHITRLIDGQGGHEMTLPSEITDAVTTPPTFKTRHTLSGAWTTVSTSVLEYIYRYEGRTTNVVRTDGLCWPVGSALVEVSYTTGWKELTLPKDLRKLLKEKITIAHRDRLRLTGRVTGTDQGDRSVLSQEAMGTMESYRAPVVETSTASVKFMELG